MIKANTIKDLMAAVHLASDGSQHASGTVYCVARLESDDSDDGKYWDSNDDTWQASPVAWPEATHTQAGQWVFALPAAASNGKAGDTIHYTFTDNLTEASATTVCGGGEHKIYDEDMLAATLVDLVWDEVLSDAAHTTTNSSGNRLQSLGNPIATTISDASPSTTEFDLAAGSSTDDWYNDQVIMFTSGTLIGLVRIVSDYVGATKTITIDEALPQAPGNGDKIELIGQHAHPKTQIADAVWDEALSAHTNTGSAGEALGVVGPVGTRAITIHTQDDGAANLGGVRVSLYSDSGRTALVGRVTTDAAGDVTIGLADGTYYWSASKNLYSFTPSSFVVSGSATKTITGTGVSPSVPASPNACTVYGTILDATGTPVNGETIKAVARVPDSANGNALSLKEATATTDASGYFELELVRESQVVLTCATLGIAATYTVPDSATQDITTWTADSYSTTVSLI